MLATRVTVSTCTPDPQLMGAEPLAGTGLDRHTAAPKNGGSLARRCTVPFGK
jgi:hypothetical protein